MSWAEGEGKRLDERLLSFLDVVRRWSASGAATTDREARGRGGCLNPLDWLKLLVFLLAIVLLPLMLLLFLIVRLATGGLASLGQASAIDTAGGEPARLGHGVLEPAASASAIRAEVAAIASRDPGFRASALTDWADAAVRLLCQSVTSGDATPARTFMANGLFRTHQALLGLRAEAEVSCEGSWGPVDAAVVQAISTPQFDEVRIRVSCQGWRSERHGPTGLLLRGGPDGATWSEDLTFGRSAGALTPSAGGLPARNCPSCGSPLDLDAEGVCQFCRGIVTAGRHDWVLVSWRREPW